MPYTRSKPRHQKRNWTIGGILLVVAASVLFYIYGYVPARDHEQIHVRMKEALRQEDTTFFQSTLTYNGNSLTRAEALAFERWLNADPALRGDAIAELADDRANATNGRADEGLFRLMDTGEGRFGFADYTIELLPKTLTVRSDVPLTNVWVDGERVGRIDEGEGTFAVIKMPGQYEVKVVSVVDGETVSETETIDFVDDATRAYALRPERAEVIANQFDLNQAELIESEVEAQTGYSLQVIDGLLGKRERVVRDTIGEPIQQEEGRWSYDALTVVFERGQVGRLIIDLDKSPDDLVALIGEPETREERETGTVWVYGQSWIDSFFTLFGLRSEKTLIERDGRIELEIN